MKEIEYIQVGDYQLPNLKVEEMHLNRGSILKLEGKYILLQFSYI